MCPQNLKRNLISLDIHNFIGLFGLVQERKRFHLLKVKPLAHLKMIAP